MTGCDLSMDPLILLLGCLKDAVLEVDLEFVFNILLRLKLHIAGN